MIRRAYSSFSIYRWASPVLKDLNCGCAAGTNFALHAPEDLSVSDVLGSRRALSSELNVEADSWCCAHQVHGTASRMISGRERGRGALDAADALPDTDALIRGGEGVNIMIFTADCLPLLLYDRRLRTAALVHAGWRGAAEGIVLKVIHRMTEELGSRREDLFAAAGPAVGGCCYQVDRPVFERMTCHFPECAAAFAPDDRGGEKEHWRLNLEEAVFLQLETEGVKRSQMEGSGLCSCCSGSELSSWRREGASSGRMATFICG